MKYEKSNLFHQRTSYHNLITKYNFIHNLQAIKARRDSKLISFYYFVFLLLIQVARIIIPELSESFFIITNIVFSFFVIFNIYSLRKGKRWLLNPLFLASLRMFLLAYGVTIFYIYAEGKPIQEYIDVANPFDYFNNAMIYASIGFVAMWQSYHSILARKTAKILYLTLTNSGKLLRTNLNPRWSIVVLIFFISFCFKLIFISLGRYGVINTIQNEQVTNSYQYIYVLSIAGSGALFLLSLYYFKTGNKRLLFYVFFLIDLFFSIISGFKGAIIICFLSLVIAFYLVKYTIGKRFIVLSLLSVIFAYHVISPYRYYLQTNSDTDNKSVPGILQSFINSNLNNGKNEEVEEDGDNLVILKRFNFIFEFTKFQEYISKHGLDESDPNFLYITATSPIQIFVPRFLWKNKPRADLGVVWVTQKIFGKTRVNSSTAFGPLGFLYLTGGVFAVFLGFIIIGFFLQVVNTFLNSGKWGGIIVAIFMLMSSTGFEGQFNFYVIAFVQQLLVALFFQFIILKPFSKDSLSVK